MPGACTDHYMYQKSAPYIEKKTQGDTTTERATKNVFLLFHSPSPWTTAALKDSSKSKSNWH